MDTNAIRIRQNRAVPQLRGQEALLRELTAAKPGITLAEVRQALLQRGAEPVSLTTIWSTLRRLGLSHKKSAEGG